MKRIPNTLRAASLLLVLLLCGAACSGTSGDGADRPPAATTETTFQEGTLAVPGGSAQQDTTVPEDTTGGQAGAASEVLLRIEGDPKTGFTGLCSAGGQESVLSGRVPKRFTFDLDEGQLACRIQKRGERGTLRVVLLVGDSTRSVQQTNAPRGVINVSYSADQGG